MSYIPGQRVVCIDAHGAPELRKFAIYTVRGYRPIPGVDCLGRPTEGGVKLYEVEALSPKGFASNRFRPIRETSIEIFRAMLVNPPREIVDA